MTNVHEFYDEAAVTRKERFVVGSFLAIIGLLTVFDVFEDFEEHVSWAHIIPEITTAFISLLIAAHLFKKFAKSRQRSLLRLSDEIKGVKKTALIWKEQSQRLRKGLSEAITQQLASWNLSPAEQEVSFFLLKGFSLREISEIRNTSEKTIRLQASSIYKKSGLAGRAELSAFFLEDLLSPMIEES